MPRFRLDWQALDKEQQKDDKDHNGALTRDEAVEAAQKVKAAYPVFKSITPVEHGGKWVFKYMGSEGTRVGLEVDYNKIRAYRGVNVESILIEYRVDLRLITQMGFIGRGKSGTNAAGWERNAAKHFESLLDKHPEFWSKANVARIEGGVAPIVDETFVEYFPQYRNQIGDKIIHHHIGGGGEAAAVPQSLHEGFGGIHNIEKVFSIRGNDRLSEIGQVFTGTQKVKKAAKKEGIE